MYFDVSCLVILLCKPIMFRWFVAITLFVSSFGAVARNGSFGLDDFEDCFSSAGAYHGIDPLLLKAIAKVESDFKPSAISINKGLNPTRDIGLMQINSWWLPVLKEFAINENDLLDACTSIYVGAWILKDSINRYGNNWRAVGAYNAGTGSSDEVEVLRKVYADRVYSVYSLIGLMQ